MCHKGKFVMHEIGIHDVYLYIILHNSDNNDCAGVYKSVIQWNILCFALKVIKTHFSSLLN